MTKIFRALCLLLARAVDDELRRMVQFLKAENEILRSKLPTRVSVTPEERSRLVRFGRAFGGAAIGFHRLAPDVSGMAQWDSCW